MKKEKLTEIKLDLTNPFKNKTFVRVLAATAVIGLTVAGTYVFANNYTLNFRSPVILQNPVLVNERESRVYIKPDNVKEEFTLEATESAEIIYSPSARLVAHTKQRPYVYGRIVEHFGDESMKYGELISRESSLNPQAINPSSGACGLAQALPCEPEKFDCSLDDVDCQLAWIGDYVERRYGNIDNALAFHDSNNWY